MTAVDSRSGAASGSAPARSAEHVATPMLQSIDGRLHCVIDHLELMRPFLMSVVSDGDRWMFASTSGALTAGRGSAATALFPYVTDDRLHGAGGLIGPVARLRVVGGDTEVMWRPFHGVAASDVVRSVAKSVIGDSVRFEERHRGLGLTIRSRWSSSDRFGFVRTITLVNEGTDAVTLDVLDGLVDVMPFGLDPAQYQRFSNLTHAYKRSEVIDTSTGLAVFCLESPVSDRAEPEEVLRATVVWPIDAPGEVSLDATDLTSFERGDVATPLHLVTGLPGAYLIRGQVRLGVHEERTWHLVADVGLDQAAVARLRRDLRSAPSEITAAVAADARRTGDHLEQIMGQADGMQCTGDHVAGAHHLANVVYNVLRGGVPLTDRATGLPISASGLSRFVATRNRMVAARHSDWLVGLPETLTRADLVDRVAERVAESGDAHLSRLVSEYLPLSFSRRHGDPSRPWNEFSIRVTDDEGRPIVYFEGNWRDVFQNWEALCDSYPELLPGIVSMFVNASTIDGYNPYRITSDGVDWEVPDPDDPWSNIGYWGDHQIVYLLRLLEATDRYLPGTIEQMLCRREYTYADVPYRIADHDDLIVDPKATIRFDERAHERSMEYVDRIGTDGRLLLGDDGEPVLVDLLEKLLVPALAKLCNFVPGGGIWMNTQRPEWNDANNALVGFGTSMVTLFHLRRYLGRLRDLVGKAGDDPGISTGISTGVASWMRAVAEVLSTVPARSDDPTRHRRLVMDRLGNAASDHRRRVVEHDLSGATEPVTAEAVVALCDAAIRHLDETISQSRRPDGLAHSYNIVGFPTADRATIKHLPVMLEGQVAALSCGHLAPSERADVIDALFDSVLYRPDQRSFTLAPPDGPPAFLDKNRIDRRAVERTELLAELVAAGDRSVVRRDADGTYRFAPELTHEPALLAALDALGADARWSDEVEHGRETVVELYRTVFEHRSHLGRSQSMYAYEGVGSIYWHMVAKLVLAAQEAVAVAVGAAAPNETVIRLAEQYWRLRDGLGFCKTPAEFGAVPIDPYSHTPAHAGAQQPGMTGAVKEEILARRRELGVRVEDGDVWFDSVLVRDEEWLSEPSSWRVQTVGGVEREVELPAGTFGFTFCQVPFVVSRASADAAETVVTIRLADGSTHRSVAPNLGPDVSASIFARRGEVLEVRVELAPS